MNQEGNGEGEGQRAPQRRRKSLNNTEFSRIARDYKV